MSVLVKHDITPMIIKLGHFALSNNTMLFDKEGEQNVEKLEKLLGKPITEPDTIIDSLPNAQQIDADEIDYPHMWESGASYEVYKFNYGGKTYYAVKDCYWNTDSWVCYIDIYDNYKDVKDDLKSFYRRIIDEIEDAKPNILDDDIYAEMEDLEDYAEEQIKKLK